MTAKQSASLDNFAFDIATTVYDPDDLDAIIADAIERKILTGDQMSDTRPDGLARHP